MPRERHHTSCGSPCTILCALTVLDCLLAAPAFSWPWVGKHQGSVGMSLTLGGSRTAEKFADGVSQFRFADGSHQAVPRGVRVPYFWDGSVCLNNWSFRSPELMSRPHSNWRWV